MKQIKMKALLEGFAWERESGKPLPTIADVAKKHRQNLKEADLDSLVGDSGEEAATDPAGGSANTVTKKFDTLVKDKTQFQKVVSIFTDATVVKQTDFLLHLLDVLGAPEDTRKKLKMKL